MWTQIVGKVRVAHCPDGAFYDTELRQYLLPYEIARAAQDPDQCVLDFLEFTYGAAADLAGWDRRALEIEPNRWGEGAARNR